MDFIWYILGDGEERERLMYLITDAQLENQVVLPGVFENPFPFFKQCSCFVMSSIYEAQPMVLNEALTLGIPVITTDFSSSQEIVKNMENGIIAENSAEGLLKAVTLFINEPCVRNQLKAGAKKFVYDNKRILSQIYELFEINGRN